MAFMVDIRIDNLKTAAISVDSELSIKKRGLQLKVHAFLFVWLYKILG